jgi:FTR1 family protein
MGLSIYEDNKLARAKGGTAVEALVITFREGIEAVLVVGIMLAFLRRGGSSSSTRSVIAGVVTAVVFSLGTAFALSRLGISADQPVVEGVLFLVAALAVAGMVVWMARAGRQLRAGIEGRMSGILGSGKRGVAVEVALFAFSFFMVAREGVEMVLFLSASAVGAGADRLALIGGLVGLALALVYGVLLIRGSARIDLRLFFVLTSAVLGLLSLKLFGTSIHEFEEAGVIPMAEGLAHAFDWIAKSTALDWLFLAALTLPMLMPWLRARTGARIAGAARH